MKIIGNKQNRHLGNKGFAISGIIYPILILALFLIVQILIMMASRKVVLDKNKQQLLDSINLSNKVYTNEELSILLKEAQDTIKTQNDKINLLEKTIEEHKVENETQQKSTRQKTVIVSKMVNTSNKDTSKIVVNLGESSGPISISVRLIGQYYSWNYGGYAQYDMGAFMTDGTCYGFGETLEKKGKLGEDMSGINTVCTQNSSSNQIIEMKLQFANSNANGSRVYAAVTIFHGEHYPDKATVSFE